MRNRQDLSWVWVWISALLSVVGLGLIVAFFLGWGPGLVAFIACTGVGLFFRGLAWQGRRQDAQDIDHPYHADEGFGPWCVICGLAEGYRKHGATAPYAGGGRDA